jgi:menaquinone-specific isochorismate synthase
LGDRLNDFAFLRNLSGEWHVGYGKSAWAEVPKGPSFFAPDFFLRDERPWLTFERTEIWPEKVWKAHTYRRFPPKLFARFESPDRDRFLDRVGDLLGQIERQEIQKAVPVEFECASDYAKLDWASLLKNIPATSTQFPYGFWTAEEALLGVTPEVLFSVKDKKLTTMALAGTAKASGPSLLEDPKERHEHQLVIDDVAARMKSFGAVGIGETIERVLPTLKHLFTPIEVALSGTPQFSELVQALHPTPALGGFPREAAAAWLKNQPEAEIRKRFGAPFGFFDGESSLVVVAIRNVQLHSEKLWLGAGCGVVKGSEAEKEWDELKLKRDSVRGQLGIM